MGLGAEERLGHLPGTQGVETASSIGRPAVSPMSESAQQVRASSLDRNLAVLGEIQPGLASQIAAALPTSGVRRVTGRDGRDTYQLQGPDGAWRYLGGSSMPSISAPQLLAAFQSDGSNVCLPGVQTGLEPLELLSRMPPHSAVFVLEHEALRVRLALELYDYAAAMLSRRLVWIVEQDPVRGLAEFLKHHPGYEFPVQIAASVQVETAVLADLARRLQLEGSRDQQRRAVRLEALGRVLAARVARGIPERPTIAILSADARPEALAEARRIERAARGRGWTAGVCVPDRPDRCHLLARVQLLADVVSDFVLIINGRLGRLGPWVPPTLPVASWFLPGAVMGRESFAPPAPNESVFVAGAVLEAAFRRETAGALRAIRLDPGADDPSDSSADADGKRALRWDATVFMDLPDDRAAACGVTLPSQLRLWEALRRAAGKCALDGRSLDAAALLAEAQVESGTSLLDADVRGHFETLTRERIVPAALGRVTVHRLAETIKPLAVVGSGWHAVAAERAISMEVLGGASPEQWLRGTRLLVIPQWTDGAVTVLLNALSVQCPVACRGERERFAEDYPALAELAEAIRFYRTLQEVVGHVRAVAATVGKGATMLAAAKVVRERHALGRRLEELLGHVRARAGAALQEAQTCGAS